MINPFIQEDGRVLVLPDPQQTKVGLIIIPDKLQARADTGKVINKSADVEEVEIGCKVFFHRASCHRMDIDGVEYFMINADEILGYE